MTTDEFRAQSARLGNIENIEVNRPLRDVATTFRERASACLQDLRTTTRSTSIFIASPTTVAPSTWDRSICGRRFRCDRLQMGHTCRKSD